ncbi:DUF2637 domain-containing protein [Luedemannella flava]|uniref:DUF2637 domain-containing protein n=1 Tax=Luedemannella flava TaxID=349316 RepID=UPI00360E23AD
MVSPDERPSKDGWVGLGLAVSAISAATSSFDGLRSLAVAAGWPLWQAPLLPLAVDSFALAAVRVWLSGRTRSQRAEGFARAASVAAVALSLAGNAVWHLVAAGLVPVRWPVVLAVGAVPPVVLFLVGHLATARMKVDERDGVRTPPSSGSSQPRASSQFAAAAGSVPSAPRPRARSRPPRSTRSEVEILAAARDAEAVYRAAHDGRPISRDALRQALRIGGPRATELVKVLRSERAAG